MTETLGRWRQVRLGDCAEIVAGYAFKSKQFTDDPNDIHLIKGADVQQGYVNWDGCKHWPKEDAANYSKFRLVEGDVILAMDRPWVPAGLKWAWIKSGAPEALLVQRVSRLRGNNGLLTDYLRYLIASRVFEDYIRPIVTGVNVPHISGKQIADFSFRLPDLSTQGRIAAILSAYDDLIENNLRRIKILEEMAQNLYREWFVKFHFPGHEQVRMVDSPLGKIPEGWEAVPMEDVCARITDGAHRSPKSVESGFPMASVKDMHNWGINVQTCRRISEEEFRNLERNDCKMREDDVLVAKDGSYLKHCFVVEKDLDVALLSSIAMLRPNARIRPHILATTLLEPDVKTRMKGYVSGAALPRIILKEFRKFQIVLAPKKIQEEWAAIAEPMIELCRRLMEKNNNLRQTRELLLPKLISGELDVSSLPIAVPEEAA